MSQATITTIEVAAKSRRLAAIRSRPNSGPIALSSAQKRLWFINQLEPASAVYNIPVAVRLKGSLDISALHKSLNEIVARHEALRTRFICENGKPFQVVSPPE